MKKLHKLITAILILIDQTIQFCGSYPALTSAEGFNQDRGGYKEGKFDFPSKKNEIK